MRRVLAQSTYVTIDGHLKMAGQFLKAFFLQAQKGASKCRYTSLQEPSLCDNNQWEFLMGTFVDASGRLEGQRAISPEGCPAKRPWHRNCHMACDAMAHGGHASFEGCGRHECMEPRCLDGNYNHNSRNVSETAKKKERGLSVGLV